MTRRSQYDDGGDEIDEDEEGVEEDVGFAEDMEALRQACMITGNNLDDLPNKKSSVEGVGDGGGGGGGGTGFESEEDDEDDLEFVRSIGRRFSLPSDLVANPIRALPGISDDDEEEDDLETLRAVRRRFAAYDENKNLLMDKTEDLGKKVEQVQATNIASRIEASTDVVVGGTSASKAVAGPAEASNEANLMRHDMGLEPCTLMNQSVALMDPKSSSFPKSALVFIDAIKKNRSCQKLLRSKLTQIEARVEENKTLMKRAKTFKEIQASCRKITGKELAQSKDPRVQLISAGRVSSSSMGSKVIDKRVVHRGPKENPQVAKYRMALRNHPLSLDQKKKTKDWTRAERENLAKGIRQQFQEMILKFSVDKLSGSEGSAGDTNNLDNVLASIRDMEITPEKIREFLPRVDWDRLASMYVMGRSGSECEARWLNWEDPLINHCPWAPDEDKKLLFIVQSKGLSNWLQISSLLGTNRTPFQCLKRFQRSLNACMLKSEWDSDEDARLLAAVETFGENNWQSVASALGRRTGSQCSNRWRKAINPDRQRKGRWTADEDIRLKIAVKIFGPKSWGKVAQYLPGRTHDKCRDRWVNGLDPSLNLGEWTGEEDLRLEAAIKEHGYAWSKVAKQLPGRTDNACKRRWKQLFPHEFTQLQAAKKMEKAALVRNFVDREKERPALGPEDFVPTPMLTSDPGPKKLNQPQKLKMKSRLRVGPVKKPDRATGNTTANIRSKRRSKRVQTSSAISPCISGTEGENVTGNHAAVTRRKKKSCSKENCHSEAALVHLLSNSVSESLPTARVKQGDTVVKQGDTVKEKSLHKQDLRGKMHTEADGNCERLPESQESGSNGNSLQTQEDSATSSKKSRANKQVLGSNKNAESGEQESGELSGTTTAETEESDILGQPDGSSNKRVPEPHSRRKTTTEVAEDNCCLLWPTENLELSVTYNRDIDISSDKTTLPKEIKVLKQYSRRKKVNEQPAGAQVVNSLPAQQMSENVEDDVTLASLLQNAVPKKRKKEKSLQLPCGQDCKCATLGTQKTVKEQLSNSHECEIVSDDTTLASFLRGKLRKCQIRAETGLGSSSSSHEKPELALGGVESHKDVQSGSN